jgi:outer membrane receptor protein involved in Fe transport
MRIRGWAAALALALAGAAHAQSQEVVVTGQRPPAQVKLDRKVYDVTRDLQASSGSAADVLNNIASVNVDADGVVTLRADANVTILVDGKPSAQFAGSSAGTALLQFPASDIDRVEVLTNPPAQYKAAGSAGVINIVTKKRVQAGLTGAERINAGQFGRYVLGLDVSYGLKGLKLSGGVGLRHDIRERQTSTDRLVTDPVSLTQTQSAERIDEHFHRLTPSAKASFEYQLNPRQSLGGSINTSILTGHRFFDQTDVSAPVGGSVATSSLRHSDGHEWHVDAGEGAHFEQKLRRPDESLTLAIQRSLTRERERYYYTNTSNLPPAPQSFDDLHLHMDLVATEASADYDLPLSHDRELKLGYDFEADRNRFDNLGHTFDPITGAPIVDPAVSNDFRYRSDVHAFYGQYQAPFGPWRLQAGVRMEAAYNSWLLVTGDIPGHRKDFGVYPSLHLERTFGEDGRLTLGISRRINRPDPEALNPFPDHQDTHNLRAGNPDLRPQDTWSAEAGYVFTGPRLTWGVTGYSRIDHNKVTDIVVPVSATVVLATKANLPQSRSAGVEFNVGGKLGRRISYSLSANGFWTQIEASQLGAFGLKSTTGVDLKASVDWRPTRLDTLQVAFSRQSQRLTPQGEVSAINLVNLGLKHQLRPNFALLATVSDVFDGQRYQRVITTPVLHDDYVRHQLGRIAYIGFVYTFGGPAKPSGFDYEQ